MTKLTTFGWRKMYPAGDFMMYPAGDFMNASVRRTPAREYARLIFATDLDFDNG
jgi:hypothetical protein